MNAFELAKQKRLELYNKERSNKQPISNLGMSNTLKFLGLDKNPKVFRIVGNPFEIRSAPYDTKLVFVSRIVDDYGKRFVNIIWDTFENPSTGVELNQDWILYRMIYNYVYKKEFVLFTDEQKKTYMSGGVGKDELSKLGPGNENGYYRVKNQEALSYKRLERNKIDGNNIFGYVLPKKKVVMNVIDRGDDFCSENKQTKLLSSNAYDHVIKELDGSSRVFTYADVGISYQLYNMIFNKVVNYKGDWDIDIVVWKTSDPSFYEVRDLSEKKLFPDIDLSNKIRSISKVDKLSEEELNYKVYDLDSVYRRTSYNTLKKNFERLFKQVDLDYGTKFYDELVELCEVELKEFDSLKNKRQILMNRLI